MLLVAALASAEMIAGWLLVRPARAIVGAPPSDLGPTPVEFHSLSGATLRGWFVPGRRGAGAVVLMHGVRADRHAMLARARFLHQAGYAC